MIRKYFGKSGLTTTRIEAFSDGVFAIAMTLLVIEIGVPELSSIELQQGELLKSLIHLWPKFLSFVISFGVISIFWVGHAIMFHFIKKSDRILLWLNTLMLMFIAFMPFPAALIGEYTSDISAVILYGATQCATGLMFALTWFYASKNNHLIDPKTPENIVCLASKVVWIAPLIYAIAMATAFINPIISIVIYILVPLAYIIPSPIDEIVEAADTDVK